MAIKVPEQSTQFRDFLRPDPVPQEFKDKIKEQSDTAKMLYDTAQIKIPTLIRIT